MIVLYVVVALLMLLVMITVHEFGHYLAGKIFKFKIYEFAIGFGPAIVKTKNKKNGEIFSVRAFPLGGYCAFGEDDKPTDDPHEYNNQKPWKRLIVLAAGAIFNFIFGVIFTAIMLMTIGYDIPKIKEISPQISSNQTIYADNPNYVDGQSILKKDDVILKVNGKSISVLGMKTLNSLVAKCDVGENTLTIIRDGKKQDIKLQVYETPEFTVKMNDKGEPIDVNGVVIDANDVNAKDKYIFLPVKNEAGEVIMRKVVGIAEMGPYVHGFFRAIGRAPEVSIGLGFEVFKAFINLFTGQIAIKELSGPIGSIATIATVSEADPSMILAFVPIISFNLAVFNLLPIPALDGGRMVFVIIEWIRKKPIKREVEGMIHFVGMCLLLGFVIILDIVKALI